MRMIPEHLIKCLDNVGFINEVQSRVSKSCNLNAAYNDVENEMEHYFGKRKFSDYATFRVILSRHNKKKLADKKSA
jgi:hypothetical protein